MNLISLNIFHITKISIYRKTSHFYLLGPNFVAGISGLTFKNNEKKTNFVIQWWCQFNGKGYPLKSPNCKLNDYSQIMVCAWSASRWPWMSSHKYLYRTRVRCRWTRAVYWPLPGSGPQEPVLEFGTYRSSDLSGSGFLLLHWNLHLQNIAAIVNHLDRYKLSRIFFWIVLFELVNVSALLTYFPDWDKCEFWIC